jgi:phenolic acid decarboxylase
MCPRSRKDVNRSRIVKCSNHDWLIMKAGRMKNRDVRIMYVLQTLSTIIYTHRCAMENIQSISKHPVAMNSMFLGTSPPHACSVINFI